MFVDLSGRSAARIRVDPLGRTLDSAPQWSVVLPFFNEREALPRTLCSLAAQRISPIVILVDNGSTDGSGRLATTLCRALGIRWVLLEEAMPGKVAALQTGLAAVQTRYVATCDADTVYPCDYLAKAGTLLAQSGAVAALAWFRSSDVTRSAQMWRRLRVIGAAKVLPRQCHSGGAGQAFVTTALRKVGGFDPGRWNLVLEDHEIIERIAAVGAVRYGSDHWCSPSRRPRNRVSTRWHVFERLLYHVTPRPWRAAYFDQFLRGRLRRRGLASHRLREAAPGVSWRPTYDCS